MKTIARFQVPEDAHLFRAFLENSGIAAYIWDENIVQWFGYYSNTVGGVRVVVGDSDADEAIEECQEYLLALATPPPSVSVARVWPLVLVLSFFAGIPALAFGRRYLDADLE